MQIKTTMRYHLTLSRRLLSGRKEIINVWRGGVIVKDVEFGIRRRKLYPLVIKSLSSLPVLKLLYPQQLWQDQVSMWDTESTNMELDDLDFCSIDLLALNTWRNHLNFWISVALYISMMLSGALWGIFCLPFLVGKTLATMIFPEFQRADQNSC